MDNFETILNVISNENDIEKDMDTQMEPMDDLFTKGDVQLLNQETDVDISFLLDIQKSS